MCNEENEENEDILLNQEKLFEKYYHDALAIRAICDDMDFPGEYSPVFVNIHIHGVAYFQNLEKESSHYEEVFELLSPHIKEQLKESLEEINSESVKKLFENICIGKEIEELDAYLEETTGAVQFLRNQLENQKSLYLDEEYREHMLALYIFFVKPYIGSYTDEKIEKAFYRGKLRDINRKLKKNQNRE